MFSVKKMIAFALVAGFLIQVTVDSANAGNGKRRGTAGAQELLIPIGSRGGATGGSNQALAYGTDAMFWNPAGMGRTQAAAEASFSRLTWIADIDVTYVAAMANFTGLGAIGFSVKSLDFGEIPVTTTDATDGTGEMYSPSFITVGLTYSRIMTDRIAVGFTTKFITESIMRESANGFALDVGIQYSSGPGGYRLGVVLKNLGPDMVFTGPDLDANVQPQGTEPGTPIEPRRIVLQNFEIPATLELGVGYELLLGAQNSLNLTGNFINNNFSLDEIKVGAEYSMNDMLFLRGGYAFGYDGEARDEEATFTADSPAFMHGLAFGTGLKYDLSADMTMNFDYAYQVAHLFDKTQYFTLTLSF